MDEIDFKENTETDEAEMTVRYNPFDHVSRMEDALVLSGCISHVLEKDRDSEDIFFRASQSLLLDACVCLLYREKALENKDVDFSMNGLVDLLQNDISHNEDKEKPSIKQAYADLEDSGISIQDDFGLKKFRMFQASVSDETALSIELDLYMKISAIAGKPLVG